jgi:hypothetical protein
MELRPDESEHLVCADCGLRADEGAAGCRAYFKNDEPKEVRTFCPECAARAFREREPG